jgi:F-type H+-transporting ATPase subunit delta
MSNVPVARRYARALLDAVGAQADEVLAQLEALCEFFEKQREMFVAISSPALARPQRTAITNAVVAGSAEIHPMLANLLRLLTDRNRFSVLPIITKQYRDLVDARIGRVRGSVTSAVALDATQIDGIRRSLEKMTKQSVELESNVDSSLLGGVVAKVGSHMYDGSLRSQLRELKQSLQRPMR